MDRRHRTRAAPNDLERSDQPASTLVFRRVVGRISVGPYGLHLPYLEHHGQCTVRLPDQFSLPAATVLLSTSLKVWYSTNQRFLFSCSSLYGIFLRSTPLILPFWVLQWTAFDMAQSLFSTVSSCMIQDLDAGGIGTGTMVLHALFSWIFLPVYGSCEGLIKAYAIFYPPKGFHVIEKM